MHAKYNALLPNLIDVSSSKTALKSMILLIVMAQRKKGTFILDKTALEDLIINKKTAQSFFVVRCVVYLHVRARLK